MTLSQVLAKLYAKLLLLLVSGSYQEEEEIVLHAGMGNVLKYARQESPAVLAHQLAQSVVPCAAFGRLSPAV